MPNESKIMIVDDEPEIPTGCDDSGRHAAGS